MKLCLNCKSNLQVILISLIFVVFFGPLLLGQEDKSSTNISEYSEIIDSVSAALNEIYVFPALAMNMEKHIRQLLAEGAFDNINDRSEFLRILGEELYSICHDKHLRIMEASPDDLRESIDEEDVEQQKLELLKKRQYINFGFKELKRMQGNIGYLKLDGFTDASDGGNTAVAAMNFLAYCDAIIIDLRENKGGYPSMIQLLTSYFFDDVTHLNSFYIRKEDTTIQFWTQAHVQGPRLTNTLLYLLTSNQTFSAGEEFTYDLKNLKRATVVGEPTRGGAHPVIQHIFKNLGVRMTIPFGRAINPITGTNWEGTGVEPDIPTSADSALDVAYMDIIRKLLETEKDENKRNALSWQLDSFEADQLQLKSTKNEFKQYVGTYGLRRIWVENDILNYQREGEDPLEMIPMKTDLFSLKGLDHFRIQFTRDKDGKVVELVGLYDNGRRDTNPRTK